MLPTLNTPTFFIEMIGTKEKIKFRPFLVKEEKLLILASESEDRTEMLNAMQEIVNVCSFGEIDGRELPFFELQNIFIKLRSQSIGQISEFNLICGECGHKTPSALDLESIKPTTYDGHTNKIQLTPDLGIVMRYPRANDLGDNVTTFDLVVDCIETVFTKEEVFHTKEIVRSEVEQFVDSLTSDQFKKITEFFLTMPKIEHKIEYNCPSCNTGNIVILDGVESFFE